MCTGHLSPALLLDQVQARVQPCQGGSLDGGSRTTVIAEPLSGSGKNPPQKTKRLELSAEFAPPPKETGPKGGNQCELFKTEVCPRDGGTGSYGQMILWRLGLLSRSCFEICTVSFHLKLRKLICLGDHKSRRL